MVGASVVYATCGRKPQLTDVEIPSAIYLVRRNNGCPCLYLPESRGRDRFKGISARILPVIGRKAYCILWFRKFGHRPVLYARAFAGEKSGRESRSLRPFCLAGVHAGIGTVVLRMAFVSFTIRVDHHHRKHMRKNGTRIAGRRYDMLTTMRVDRAKIRAAS